MSALIKSNRLMNERRFAAQHDDGRRAASNSGSFRNVGSDQARQRLAMTRGFLVVQIHAVVKRFHNGCLVQAAHDRLFSITGSCEMLCFWKSWMADFNLSCGCTEISGGRTFFWPSTGDFHDVSRICRNRFPHPFIGENFADVIPPGVRQQHTISRAGSALAYLSAAPKPCRRAAARCLLARQPRAC